ncbi:hypothetical protein [Nostoc sp. 106C]|uniref:hypothetical protein n=1 Tax=Nostoc sp. 106C TaxID=1932667 RepID=UPI000A3C6CD6|nr:hypothetical protein [Nostoc sp. 106C]OUL17858.1 hypothetical protein BV375_35075 [Nostoc sp. 106C]
MPNIKISELQAVGYELLNDSESFLQELTDHEVVVVGQGVQVQSVAASGVVVNLNFNNVNGNTANANTFGNVNTVAYFRR